MDRKIAVLGDIHANLDALEEGTLRWIPESEVLELPLWEGDRLFLEPMLETDQQIHMKLTYRGDDLVEAKWDTFGNTPPAGSSLCSHKI